MPTTKRQWADLWALTKPGVTRMSAITAAGGAYLAPGVSLGTAIAGVIGVSLSVASASAFNMWLEQGTDPLMPRTRNRPLATGRLNSTLAFVFASMLGLASLVVLGLFCNALTVCLTLWAMIAYVGVYTPLKYRTPLALLIGAVPGAMPPLLGWTAITGEISAGGLALFAILLVWQMPHFIAIALFRKAEYARAGIQCVPVVRGDGVAKVQALAWALALVPVSLLPSFVGVTGWLYAIVAGAMSLWFFVRAGSGLVVRSQDGVRWARSLFLASLVYLPVLIAAMAVDVMLF